MTLGSGVLIAMSTKQKLNTTSSTEVELAVGMSDSLTFHLIYGRHTSSIMHKVVVTWMDISLGNGTSCIKIMNRVSNLRAMERHLAASAPDTLTSDTLLSPIEWRTRRLKLTIVRDEDNHLVIFNRPLRSKASSSTKVRGHYELGVSWRCFQIRQGQTRIFKHSAINWQETYVVTRLIQQ